MDYRSSQLIAYIGNKRRLLPFLEGVFCELQDELGKCGTVRFADPFAGSGSVSRLGVSLGYEVYSNDWEFYSYIINSAYIGVDRRQAATLFSERGGLEEVVRFLNNEGADAARNGLSSGEEYISLHYAPRDTGNADYRYERMFYTAENARFIDRVRGIIEDWYPGWALEGDSFAEKCLLTAPLLYQAATRANTSGVFKACHKGFGGHGKDALKRIMGDAVLEAPCLAGNPGGLRHVVCRDDAASFVKNRSFDICYLDPPYNQHQYGSNYFMLNTIAKWDKPEVSGERNSSGILVRKAGIRPDWTDTRSGFCYGSAAPQALRRLLDAVDAKCVVLSYNTEGIIPFEELTDILSSYGRTTVFCKDYTVYRGGRQSLSRVNNNIEFQLVLYPGRTPKAGDRRMIDSMMTLRAITALSGEPFHPERIRERFDVEGDGIKGPSGRIFGMERFYRFRTRINPSDLSGSDDAVLSAFLKDLGYCRCASREEEAGILIGLFRDSLAAEGGDVSDSVRIWKRLLSVVRKFAFRKYDEIFRAVYDEMSELAEVWQDMPGSCTAGFEELGRLAAVRFSG